MGSLTSNTDAAFLTLECVLKYRAVHVAESQRTSPSRQGTLAPEKFGKRLQQIGAWSFTELGLDSKNCRFWTYLLESIIYCSMGDSRKYPIHTLPQAA